MILIISPWIKDEIIKIEIKKYQLENFSHEELKKNYERRKELNTNSSIGTPDFLKVIKNISSVNRENVLGAIIIEELDLSLPIIHGTTTENLLVGATTVLNEQKMGEGNYVLAGHHMRDDTLLFSPLLKAKEGMEINITDKKDVFTYKVTDIKLVHETNLNVLNSTEVPTLTLLTCDVYNMKTQKRIVIVAELVKRLDYKIFDTTFHDGEKIIKPTYSFKDFLWLGFIIISCMCLLLIFTKEDKYKR
ncbi:class A sortase [Cytobacillus sp. Sa5YUA1]|uniref:Class A sortase n=1 Tax=Cytobacillus stercorigallinarum TaxID=2762240 RepID=A0ABR8QLN1_9BACI|nr:class A sortase [Cytobacillus stercorigallinarum]MBD7936428.1 class A sortase [Cytobacillus stercorigallinarum]